MKVFIALAVLVAVCIAAPAGDTPAGAAPAGAASAGAAPAGNTPAGDTDYAASYDFEALFKNDEQRKAALECILDKKPCGEFQKLKDSVLLVLSTQCADCTPEQKAKYDNITKMYHDQYEAEFNELMKKIASQQKKE